jgi:radical SAM superfamily enzyme YgiQ (UPF0313 family)
MLLIHPPIAKSCEPPAGIAKLAGMLQSEKIPVSIVDASLDGILRAIRNPIKSPNTWTRRAIRSLPANLDYLRNSQPWEIGRYTRAVMDIHRVLAKSLESSSVRVSLGDYQDGMLSPLKSRDLIRSAETPEKNSFYPYFQDWLLPQSSASEDGYVGFSLNFLGQALTVFAMIGYLRRERPDIKIILGGGLTTSWLKGSGGKHPFGGLVDALVAGPGESYLKTLFGMRDCSTQVLPRYDLFPIQQYLSPGFILPYSAAAGCYWRKCLFCPEKAEENAYLPLSPEKVLDDLARLIEKYRPVLVHFLDNAMSPSLLQRLVKEPLHVPWYGFIRATDHLKDPDFCVGLKKSGCVMLKIGIESGNQRVLDSLNKGIDLETASLALKNLQKAGIATYLYFLFGTPPEGLPEARHTLDFVKKHHDAIRFLNLAIFNMPANSPDAEKYHAGQFYEGDLSLYASFEHPQGWNRDKVRYFLDEEFKKDPVIKEILRRNPPFFTSNHAAFFIKG